MVKENALYRLALFHSFCAQTVLRLNYALDGSVGLSGLDHWIELLVEDVDGDEGLCSVSLLARLEEVDGVDWDDVDVLLRLREVDFFDGLSLSALAAGWLCLRDEG